MTCKVGLKQVCMKLHRQYHLQVQSKIKQFSRASSDHNYNTTCLMIMTSNINTRQALITLSWVIRPYDYRYASTYMSHKNKNVAACRCICPCRSYVQFHVVHLCLCMQDCQTGLISPVLRPVGLSEDQSQRQTYGSFQQQSLSPHDQTLPGTDPQELRSIWHRRAFSSNPNRKSKRIVWWICARLQMQTAN